MARSQMSTSTIVKAASIALVLMAVATVTLMSTKRNSVETEYVLAGHGKTGESAAQRESCLEKLRLRVEAMNSEADVRGELNNLKRSAIVKGVKEEHHASLVKMLQAKHKVARMGNRMILLYPSNSVVVVDMLTCDVKGLYMGSESGFHPLVREHARHAISVASDKHPPPPPPPTPPATGGAHTHDVSSVYRGSKAGHHVIHNPRYPSIGVTQVCTFSGHLVNAIEFKWGTFNLGWRGNRHGHGACFVVPKESCITEVRLRAGAHLDGIQYFIQNGAAGKWSPWRGGGGGGLYHFNARGSCLKGVYMHFGHHINGIRFYFGYWCPAGFDCRNGWTGRFNCPVGTYRPKPMYNAKACVDSHPGYFIPRTGMTLELICPPGTFQPHRRQTACIDTPAGHYTSGAGMTKLERCVPGEYQPSPRQTKCIDASPGHYVNTHASAKQTPCVAGSYQPNTRQTSCLPCPPGSYQARPGGSVCLKALPGYYVAGSGATKETPCGTGTYQAEAGQTKCLLASPGHFVAGSGWSKQKACLVGYFQPKSGQATCIKGGPQAAPKKTYAPLTGGNMSSQGGVTQLTGMESLNVGYNLFRGVGARAEIARPIGTFTRRVGTLVRVADGTTYSIPDQVEYVNNPQCRGAQQSREVTWSYSVKAAMSIAKQFSMSSSMSSVAGHMCPPLWSLGVAQSTAVFYGSSMELRTSQAQAASGYTYSSSSFIDATSYNAHVNWKNPPVPFSFAAPLLNLITSINRVKTPNTGASTPQLNALVMGMFEQYGSHVIESATFGSKCSMTTYFESSASRSAVSSFVSQQSNFEFSKKVFTWFLSAPAHGAAGAALNVKTSQKSTHAFSGTFSNGKKYEVKNVECMGYVRNNLCDARWNAKSDDPAMIDYLVSPIWEVENAGWTPFGIRNVYVVLREYEEALLECNKVRCGNVGICTMKTSFWDEYVAAGKWDGNFASPAVTSRTNSIMWRNNACVCLNGPSDTSGKCSVRPVLAPLSPNSNAWVPPYEWVAARRLRCADACRMGKLGYTPYFAHDHKAAVCASRINTISYTGVNFDQGANKPATHQCLVTLRFNGGATKDAVQADYRCMCADSSRISRRPSYEESCDVTCSLYHQKAVVADGYNLNGRGTDVCVAMEPKWNLRGGYTAGKRCNIWHRTYQPSYDCLCY